MSNANIKNFDDRVVQRLDSNQFRLQHLSPTFMWPFEAIIDEIELYKLKLIASLSGFDTLLGSMSLSLRVIF